METTIKIVGITIFCFGLLAIFLGFVALSLADPSVWETTEQKKCEEMGGLYLQHSFSSDCIFKP